MPFVWAGLLLIALHGLGVGPVADWSWTSVLAPFAAALIWFEFVEPLFAPYRRSEQGQKLARALRLRLHASLAQLRSWRRRAGGAATDEG